MTASERVSRARARLLLDQPFFGTLVVRLPMVVDEQIETACTNGKVIRYNPKFFDGLTDDEIQGVLAHEVMHVANGHCWRRGNRDMEDWNKAADYAINDVIINAGMSLPKGCLVDRQFTNQSAEQIYDRVRQPKPQNGPQQSGQPSAGGAGGTSGQGTGEAQKTRSKPDKPSPGPGIQQPGGKPCQPCGTQRPNGEQSPPTVPDPGACGAVEDAPDETDARNEEADWGVAVAQAALAARAQGCLPAGLARMVDEIVNPRVPWGVVLRDFIERTARNDYTWSQPNRRYLQQGIVLPSLISEELPAVVIAIDTSGSIGTRELDQFSAEVSAVLAAYETTIHLVWCDAKVHKTETLTRADLPLSLKPCGGGGTDFRPVFQWIEQEGLTPACVIYLTDMWGTFPEREPDYPVLWVRTTDRPAPFGEVVDLK